MHHCGHAHHAHLLTLPQLLLLDALDTLRADLDSTEESHEQHASTTRGRATSETIVARMEAIRVAICSGRKDVYDSLKRRYGKRKAAAIANAGCTRRGRSIMARKAARTRRAHGR